MDVFELNGRVVVDLADAVKAFNSISKEGQQTQSKLSKAFSAVGKGAVAVGKTIGAGLLTGAAAMGTLTIKALNLGGELEQNMGGSEAVFGKYAAKMQETAKNAFSNMGLSTSDFLATANKMGALFQGAGFDIETSAKISSEAMQRAADVASIMGISTESAMEAIAGAAKGNFTMMDNLGVAMNDTTLQAYALEKGITKTTSEMTNQEKIGLAMEMFMEKTAYAAGNYAKENDTLAGSLATAKAALTNFLDGSGSVDQLVSSFSHAAEVIVKNVTEIGPRLVTGITEIANQLIPIIPPLLEKLLPPLLDGAVSLINGIVAILPSLVEMLATSVIPQLLTAFVSVIDALVSALPSLVETIVSALPTLLPLLIDALVSIIVMLCTSFGQIIQPIIDNLPDIILAIVNALLNNLPLLIEGIISLVMGITSAINQIITVLTDAIPTVVEMIIVALLQNLPAIIVGLIKLVMGIVANLNTIFASMTEGIMNVMIGIWNGIITFFNQLNVAEWFGQLFRGAWDAIKNAFSSVGQWFGEKLADIKNAFSPVGSFFKNAFTNAWNNIKNVFSGVSNFFNGIWDKIKSAFSAIGTKIGDAISGAVKKGINGLLSSAEKIINGFLKMINGAIDLINKIPGVNISKVKMVEFTRLAKGGVVDRPTPAVFGEDGAEAVVPLEKNTGWLNKVAKQLHEFSMETKSDLGGILFTRSVELQQQQVSEMHTMNGKIDRIISLLVQFFPDMIDSLNLSFAVDGRELATVLAAPMDEELGKIAIKKGRGR